MPMRLDYVQRLVDAFPEIREVWLIGSRANGTAKADSDWDYIAFGNATLLETLRSNPDWKAPGIDLMVLYNGDDFEEPWGEKPKRGSLCDWEWERVSGTCARYKAKKWKDNESGVEVKQQKSIRVWPSVR